MDPGKTAGCYYGAILGLAGIGGAEAVRVTIVPNLKVFDKVLENMSEKEDVDKVVEAVGRTVGLLGEKGGPTEPADREKLKEKIGERFAAEVERVGGGQLVKAVVEVKDH